MSDRIAVVSRSVAAQLSGEYGPNLAAKVEAALYQPATENNRYADPTAIASLIVAVVTLAWTVYNDLRGEGDGTEDLDLETFSRAARIRVQETHTADGTTTRVVEAAVTEIHRHQISQTRAKPKG